MILIPPVSAVSGKISTGVVKSFVCVSACHKTVLVCCKVACEMIHKFSCCSCFVVLRSWRGFQVVQSNLHACVFSTSDVDWFCPAAHESQGHYHC